MSEAAGSARRHALLRLRIALPFLIVALIWGSTWYVITGQIHDVPPSWSVAYRFALATPAMFIVALAMRRSLAIGRAGHLLALAVGLTQFCGNFNFVYRAELHLTSGVVAVMFGMLMVPNALFGRWLLGQKVTPRFLTGSAIAIVGIGLLLLHEARLSPLGGSVLLGVALAIGGILSASIANVIQANETGRALPMASLLAWSMLYGTGFDIAFAWSMTGPPVIPVTSAFWFGTAWLAIAGSVVTFPLYYTIVRQIGAGRAAYNGVLVIVVAMFISTLVEGYAWSTLAVAGAVLGLGGMIIALRARQV
ncbi:DMT family transporter [Pelagerythrobacter marensis]|uniref:EamA-like transporter family n=1 Tax=Pelagerythrobacter marensis TaxID=543877 RepID=A0A0G3XC33_9SPHN|nr:DMT family transporter [Pelagerythrobacter marensis]AKM08191.1 EamA-like transporter family [Pelagerythrobacter marensis]